MPFFNVACEKRGFRCAPEIRHLALCMISLGHPWPTSRLLKEFFNSLPGKLWCPYEAFELAGKRTSKFVPPDSVEVTEMDQYRVPKGAALEKISTAKWLSRYPMWSGLHWLSINTANRDSADEGQRRAARAGSPSLAFRA